METALAIKRNLRKEALNSFVAINNDALAYEVEMIITQHEVTVYQLARQFHETSVGRFAFFEI